MPRPLSVNSLRFWRRSTETDFRERISHALTIWLVLMAMAAIVLFALYRAGLQSTRATVAAQQDRVVHEATLVLTTYLTWVERDLVTLKSLGRHIQAGRAGSIDHRAFEQAFVEWMGSRTDIYVQARYIDEAGMEQARVDSAGDVVSVRPREQLQNKRDRYYVEQAMNLPAGAIGISRFDLNEEHGQIEVPLNPVIRFSTRLNDSVGQARGALVLNVRAQPLIDRIKGMRLPPGAEIWMIGSQSGQEWTFIDPKSSNVSAGQPRPALWTAIRSSARDTPQTIDVPGGMLSAITFVPQERLRLPGITLKAEEGMVWYLAAWLPDTALPIHLQDLRQRILAGGFIMALVFLAIAFYGADLLVKRRQAQEAQARSEAQYKELLASAPDAIVVTDTAGSVTYANAHTEKLFGYLPGELFGQHVDTLMPARFRSVHQDNMRRHAKTPPGRHEMASGRAIFALKRNGEEFPAIIGLNKIDGPQGPQVIATIQDVTEIRAAQATMAEANRQLTSVNKDLASFSYSVAHDLRSPLRVLNGFSELMLTEHAGQLDDLGRSYLQRMRIASLHMSSILSGMLELSRVTRSAMTLRVLDMSTLAHEMVDILRAEQPGRQVDVCIESGMHASGDPDLIKIVLLNLLGNAWKFTSKRDDPRIEMGVQHQDGQPVFFVRDNGAGFDAAHAGQLFNAFQRLHRAEEFPGTGIGLATVARVIEKHGGQIRAEAAPGQGACFFFTLGNQGSWD